jgi:hypothetical protein
MGAGNPHAERLQGFLINANRIRVSRVLRVSRTASPMVELVNIPVLPA